MVSLLPISLFVTSSMMQVIRGNSIVTIEALEPIPS
jgi:hypothetical protein